MAEENQMHMTAKPLVVQYDFYLDFEIRDAVPFYDFFAILREAGPEDVVFIHINSPGGDLDTTAQVISAINETQATVVGCAEGAVASGAAYIFFSCHACKLAEHCQFTLHSASAGMGGKVSDLSASIIATTQRMSDLMESTLGQFFTKKEIKKLLDGREHFLSAREVEERVNNALEKAQEESQ